MTNEIIYPTVQHQDAARAIVDVYKNMAGIEAVLLVNSCARNKASRHSCLDIAVLLKPDVLKKSEASLESVWQQFYESNDDFRSLQEVGKYAEVHLDFIDGDFVPVERDEVGGPDSFEIELGNRLVYSVPLWDGSDYFTSLKEQWLPYYDDELRLKRLHTALHYCHNDLDHIPLYVDRKLYFQAFERLQYAWKTFLQSLFISRRLYPIAYDKWIQEQVVEILGLPELYQELTRLFEVHDFESREIAEKSVGVKKLVERYIQI